MINKFKLTLWSVPILLIAIIGLWHDGTVGAVRSAPLTRAVDAQIDWESESDIQVTSSAGHKQGPVMRVSPDGETRLIAYSAARPEDATRYDVMYAESDVDTGWSTWITGTIHAERPAGEISRQVDVEYDAYGKAHAVWIYGRALVYKPFEDWGDTIPFELDAPSAVFGTLLYPNLVTSGGGVLDVVWLESTVAIKHARSIDGGEHWSDPDVVENSGATKTSTGMVMQGDYLHLVWKDDSSDVVNEEIPGVIKYARGDTTTSPMTWSDPIIVSNDHNAHQAVMIINDDNELMVAYTYRRTEDNQSVYVTTCSLSSNCTQLGSWASESTLISGNELGVNAETPWNVASTLVSYNGCVYAYFHGTTEENGYQDNELIWSTNSCNNWAANGRLELTTPAVQSLFPSATVNDGHLHLAYRRNPDEQDTTQQIFFRRGVPTRKVYLPVILK